MSPERLRSEVWQPVRFAQKAEHPEEPCRFPLAEDVRGITFHNVQLTTHHRTPASHLLTEGQE